MSNKNTNKLLTLFLMTKKGYELLVQIGGRYQSLLGLIVVGNDTSLQNDYEFEIIDFCQKNSLPCIKRSDFKRVETEYALAVSWRWLIDHPQDKLIVFHDSLLPTYRGFAPLVNALINGEAQVGVSAIFGASDFDTGAIIIQSTSSIRYPIKIAEAIDCINRNYLECANYVLSTLLEGLPLVATPQDENKASFSVWRDEEDYKIDWTKSASEIRRMIDAVGYPYLGAFTMLDGKKIRIFAGEETADIKIENRHCGKALFIDAGKPIVICGQGMLKITEAHIEHDGKTEPFFPLTRYRLRFTN